MASVSKDNDQNETTQQGYDFQTEMQDEFE